jgi:autotransporter-associated beta strand protein
MWLQGDWSGFTGQIEFTVNGVGTNYRLGGAPGITQPNDDTNASDFSQATFVLSGSGTDRGLSWNGAQGATVQVGTLSGTGGRIITGAGSRDANWEVGGLNADASAAVVITGPATSLTKVGTGTLTLNSGSSYGGGTTVSGGTLDLNAAGAIGSGSLTIAAGASVNALRAFAISTDAAAAGRVVNVAGSLSMVDSEYVQTYNLTGGTINAPTTGNRFLRAPTVGLTINSLAAATSSQIIGQFDLTYSSATLDVADGAAADDLVISRNISQNQGAGSGAKSITKIGAGTLLLSGTNSYAGGTFINAGLVKAGSSRALGIESAAASTVTIASGATLDINRVTGNTGDFFYGMTIAGSGTTGQGALINTGANGGIGQRQTPNITLSADAAIGGSGNILMINSAYAANSLDLAGNTLTKTGSNTLFLCNTTVSAGTIDIQQGTVSHFNNAANASAAAIALADAADATLALNNLGLQVGSLAGGGSTGGNVTLGSATLTLGGRNEDTSYGGVISGTGAVVKTGTGTQTFAAASSYSGGTTISAGTLLAGVADAFSTTGTITVDAGGTLGVGAGVNFTRAFTLNTGGKVWLGDNATIALPDAAALAAFETANTAGGYGTVADILYGSGATTPSALTSAWTANTGGYFSDILTLEGTGAGNVYVLSMTYSGSFGDMNVWYRTGTSGPFTPLGTNFQGNVAWNSGFTTVGQYGIDSATNTVWAVTDHNSQFVVVPEPGTLGLAAVGLAGGLWYLLRQRMLIRD